MLECDCDVWSWCNVLRLFREGTSGSLRRHPPHLWAAESLLLVTYLYLWAKKILLISITKSFPWNHQKMVNYVLYYWSFQKLISNNHHSLSLKPIESRHSYRNQNINIITFFLLLLEGVVLGWRKMLLLISTAKLHRFTYLNPGSWAVSGLDV